MIELRPGDIFVSSNPKMLGTVINQVQAFWEADGQCSYGHAGFLLYCNLTFEALWTVRQQDFLRAYAGQEVLVGRHRSMDSRRFKLGLREVKFYEGRWYPLHRLFLMATPFTARLRVSDWAACSELVSRFLCGAGLLDFWSGVTPGFLADMMRRWAGWKVTFQGRLESRERDF